MIVEGLRATFAMLVLFVALLLILIQLTHMKRIKFEIKRLPGLDALEEAVGRATEMGRPVVANPGLEGLRGGPVTLAGLSVVTWVSRLAARKGAKLIIPVADPELIPVVFENLKTAYTVEGASEKFDPDNQIRWLGNNQWSWAAALQGIAEREKVASNIMMGAFAAEAMILAETFARIGAFQIGGLTNTYQIPFFVAVCDYTLVGDELLAAGAYLSGDQEQIATIGAEDIFKLLFVIIIILGAILAAMGDKTIINLLKG